MADDWYEYSWPSHVLKPADRAYAIRTADGNFAVLRFLGYYCPGGRPGCVTFRYRYRGDGERTLPRVEGFPPGDGFAAAGLLKALAGLLGGLSASGGDGRPAAAFGAVSAVHAGTGTRPISLRNRLPPESRPRR